MSHSCGETSNDICESFNTQPHQSQLPHSHSLSVDNLTSTGVCDNKILLKGTKFKNRMYDKFNSKYFHKDT